MSATEALCWRGECRSGCYYPTVCSERRPDPVVAAAIISPDCDAAEHEACNGLLCGCSCHRAEESRR